MRILLLPIMLAVIDLTLARWLGEPATSRVPPEVAATAAGPTVPIRPRALKPFEQNLNRFLQDAATPRGRQADPP